ncbi:MAG: ribosome small subunit-dependent GTPase A [Calditrichaeota bacterium]|nr:MAG: ribosome small subunit-dependent GTPase A [Calditrichota bacterium]MBL1205358.1 ribosome small subunit-dependent GTPase A [Calditrichota bacterium]NOG45187.1 ribosome small subunit-dependent GTPase A [Calditrichota bacterium]
MKKLTKRQQQRIDYFVREKHSRKEKNELIHNRELPKFVEKHLPLVRRLCRNIDQLLIVGSFVSPPLKPGLIDRLLVMAEIEEIDAVICLNKADLVEDATEIEEMVGVYEKIGYTVLVTSAKTGLGISALEKLVRNKKSALAGHSGVGKSSLLNAIEPNLEIDVGDISDYSNKGTHTTTQVTKFKLDDNTELVDLPGMKKVDFIDIHKDEARFYFSEFNDFAEECKFNDCLHLTEHKCAVKNAVESGEIAEMRYKSYLTFVESLG